MTKKTQGKRGGLKAPDYCPSAMPHWQVWCLLAAILAVYVVLRLPGIGVPLDRDEGAFGYMGQLILGGGLPYLDGLDHKPPVAFYINAFALCFVPPTEQGIHLFLLIYNGLTLVCIFFLARIYFRSVSTGLWAAFAYAVFSSSPAIQGFTASTEMWMLLPISLSLLSAVAGVRRSNCWLLFMSGAIGSAACWTKPTAFTSILFVFLFVAVTVWRHKSDAGAPTPIALVRTLGSWIAGALFFSALPVMYFSYHGILGQFYYWTFQHNASYAEFLSLGSTLNRIRPRFEEIFHGDFLILCVGILGAIYRLIKRQPGGYFASGFFLLSLLGTIPGFAYRHYFAQMAPAVAVAGGCGLSTLVEFFHGTNKRLAAALLGALLILTVPIIMNSHYYLERDPNMISRWYFEANPFPESRALAAYIAQSTTPTDPVFILGSEPQILFYARRRSPSAFLMAYPMMASYPRYREFQDRWWRDVQQSPPKYILNVVNLPSTFFWDGKANVSILDRMNEWMRAHYEISGVMAVANAQGGWLTDPTSRLLQTAPCIYVFKRKG